MNSSDPHYYASPEVLLLPAVCAVSVCSAITYDFKKISMGYVLLVKSTVGGGGEGITV